MIAEGCTSCIQRWPLSATPTGWPGSQNILTSALVNTKHPPARHPPATAHPTPCSQSSLASPVRPNSLSILTRAAF